MLHTSQPRVFSSGDGAQAPSKTQLLAASPPQRLTREMENLSWFGAHGEYQAFLVSSTMCLHARI